MKLSARLLISALVFGLAFQSPLAWSAGTVPCKVLISDHKEASPMNEYDLRHFKYRVVGGKSGHETRAIGHLNNDEVALGFDLDGSIKIYYGNMEAMLDRSSDLSFAVIPVEHELDITRHDMVFIYRNLWGTKVMDAVKSLFATNESERKTIPGYNPVDAICKIMRSDNCTEYTLNRYHLDKLIKELIIAGSFSHTQSPEIYVNAEVKSPEQFLKKLTGRSVADSMRVADKWAQRIMGGTMIVASGIMAALLVLIISDMYFGW